MRAFIRLAPWLISLALVHGCFKESSSSDDDGNSCPDGSEGCDCYGNGTCDNGLECVEGKCFEPDCIPGEELCRCNDGLCLGDLVCVDGVCRPPSDGGDGGDGSGGDGSGADDGSGGTTGGTGGNTGTEVPTGPPPECEPDPGDPDCMICIKESCCGILVVCLEEEACGCALMCMLDGDDPATCGQTCGPSEVMPELDMCMVEACPVCLPDDPCQPPDYAPACTHCAAEVCCAELAACVQNPECACMEGCAAPGVPMDECMAECGVDAASLPEEWGVLQECAAGSGCADDEGRPCYE
jgi:hypothetical protein